MSEEEYKSTQAQVKNRKSYQARVQTALIEELTGLCSINALRTGLRVG